LSNPKTHYDFGVPQETVRDQTSSYFDPEKVDAALII
jgi:hypothetical protein